jgi:TolB-like protein
MVKDEVRMPDVFLSYNREDQGVARSFLEGFQALGMEVWWDVTLRSGEAYDEVTEQALRSAKAVVVLWSSRSVVSRWVRSEATLADRNGTLVPVMIEACERPIMFELTQTADLCHWKGDAGDPAWTALVIDVRRFLEKHQLAPPGPQPEPLRPLASPPARGVRGGVETLAVLPFTNRSGLQEDDVFAFGMVEDIIEAMSRGVELRVMSSSATAKFRTGAIPDIDAMAKQLGVRYVLEGNVRRVGGSLRVTTQLIDAAGGSILWTGRFDRSLEQLASLQEDLVLEVAAHLAAQSHRLEIERALRKPGNLTAWEAVMRSIAAYRRLTAPALIQAIEEANRAVEIDPDYGIAIAALAQAQGILYYLALPDDPSEASRIRELAERAVALDPDNPVVLHMAAGAFSTTLFPDRALAVAERSIVLNPNNHYAHYARGHALTLLGRESEAVQSFDRDRQLAPGHPLLWIALLWRAAAHVGAGNWTAAEATYRDCLHLTPDNATPQMGLATTLHFLGRDDEALDHFLTARRYEPETPLETWRRTFGRGHRFDGMETALDEAILILWAKTDGSAG